MVAFTISTTFQRFCHPLRTWVVLLSIRRHLYDQTVIEAHLSLNILAYTLALRTKFFLVHLVNPFHYSEITNILIANNLVTGIEPATFQPCRTLSQLSYTYLLLSFITLCISEKNSHEQPYEAIVYISVQQENKSSTLLPPN